MATKLHSHVAQGGLGGGGVLLGIFGWDVWLGFLNPDPISDQNI